MLGTATSQFSTAALCFRGLDVQIVNPVRKPAQVGKKSLRFFLAPFLFHMAAILAEAWLRSLLKRFDFGQD